MRDKRKITEQLVQQLDTDLGVTVKQAMHTWWFNLRKNGGMRLTATGCQAFTRDLKLEHYEFAIADPMQFNQQMILDLDRKMQMPYYIHATKGIPRKIVLFGGREAVMINLYGNLRKFLDNYKHD